MPLAPSASAWGAAAGAALCLGAASPPGAWPGAGWLVLPGLALLYRVAGGAHRPALLSYLIGVAYLAMQSWSLRHVVFAAYVAIALLGGVYFAVLPLWLRGLAALRVPRPLAFAMASTGAAWLRAHMPEISYPHGQPAQALYGVPALLHGPAALGGEALVNLLLAALAAAAADLCGGERRSAGVRALLAVVLVWVAAAAGRHALRGGAQAAASIDIAAIQPGLTVEDLLQRNAHALRDRQRATLVRPTLAVAGAEVAAPPDLVLWPESTGFVDLLLDAEGQAQVADATWWCAERPLPLAARSKLLLGCHMFTPEHDGTAAAVLLDSRGRLLGHHEKLWLVPGGERQPFLGWLPQAWSEALRHRLRAALGAAPHLTPGRFRPPLEVAEGVRAGILICFDNAFGELARRHVAAGANLLLVLSNEAWYRGGAELDQLEAMTVLRALETGVPVVRCTVDGVTVAFDGEGRALGRLPPGGSGTLRIRLSPPAAAGPVAPAAPLVGGICALSFVLALAQGLWAWATLRRPPPSTPCPDVAV